MDARVDFSVDQDRWALVNSVTGKVALEGSRTLVEDQAAVLGGYDAVLRADED